MLAGARVGPVVHACILTALAFVPVVAFGAVAGQELLYPMALVVLGGLVTTAIVHLFVLPPLYVGFGPGEADDGWNIDELVAASELGHSDFARR